MRNYVVGMGEEKGGLRFVCPEWVCPGFWGILESELWGWLWGDSGLTGEVLSESESLQLLCWPLTSSSAKLSPAVLHYRHFLLHNGSLWKGTRAVSIFRDHLTFGRTGKRVRGETKLSHIPVFVIQNNFTSRILFSPVRPLPLPLWSPSAGDRWPEHQDLDERTFLTMQALRAKITSHLVLSLGVYSRQLFLAPLSSGKTLSFN